MDYPVVARVTGLAPRRAKLTTDHPMSCYGQPVVTITGQAYPAGAVLWLDGSREAMEVAAEAGFSTLPSEYSQWPEYYDALPA